MQLVDEEYDALVLRDLIHHGFEAFLELTPVFRTCDHGRHVERQHPVILQGVCHVIAGDELGQPFHDGGLADTGLPDEHRVVLLATTQDLDHTFDFGLTADGGIQLALARQVGQVPAEVVERRGLGFLVPLPGGRSERTTPDSSRLRRTHVGSEHLERLGAGLFHPDAQ